MTDTIDDWMLPGKGSLLAACRGRPAAGHPMLAAAGELARLHATRERTPWSRTGPLDRRRVQLVRAIDRWVTLATPAPGPGDADEQTIGQLVDRLAHQTVLAYLPDDPAYPASPRMVALADRYQARLDDLRTGTGTPPAS
ncbi:MAG TPA: hypothetical protein VK083_20150 [Nocardia sp.]|uniref:hypothetical protein n=1 Tax=Nocardia TaxID=1817 RepID=UPI0024562E66|nr:MULTISPECIES: hypothetical protein [Nocardia]HLS79097.1 hypothetical protein [Nocardia sp.]